MSKELSEPFISVRQGEDFDRENLRKYLIGQKYITEQPLEVMQFPSGSSNLTYLIRCGDWEAVMRRPPFGTLPPKAHDMKRESNLLMKIYGHFKRIPKPYVFCEDLSIIGAPFYLMERKKGIVIDHEFPPGCEVTKEKCRQISFNVIDTLIELHSIDYKAASLVTFGKPEGFVERQAASLIKRFKEIKTEEIEELEKIANWLMNHIPKSFESTIIHNDYKLNNVILSEDLTEVVAVIDWEIATIADPLFDLGITLGYWMQADDPGYLKDVQPAVTYLPGFLSRSEIIEYYHSKTGRDTNSIHYYLVFAYFRLAVMLQQMHYRWKMGFTKDERFANHHVHVKKLIQHAYQISNQKSL